MPIQQLSYVLSQARTLLNDDNAQNFPDPVLIPKVQLAHQELQTALWDAGSPSVRGNSNILTIPANTVSITPTSSPALPTDYLTAFQLMESPNNSQAGPWIPMTEVNSIIALQLNGVIPGANLIYWQNYQDYIALLGATGTRYIQMIYRRAIPIPAVGTDSIGIPFAEQYLSYRAAALGGGSLGDPNSLTVLSAMSVQNLGKVIVANRGKQTPPVKP